jgi:hypothetical protein
MTYELKRLLVRKFFKVMFIGLAFLILTRVGTHFFITKPQAEIATVVDSERQPAADSYARVQSSAKMSKPSQDESNRDIVEIMNKRYPKMGHNGIRVDRVSYLNKLFTFHKTYTQHTVEMFDQEELRKLEPQLIAELCSSTMVDMLRNGAVGIGNSVSDKNGKLIQVYYANKEDCQVKE